LAENTPPTASSTFAATTQPPSASGAVPSAGAAAAAAQAQAQAASAFNSSSTRDQLKVVAGFLERVVSQTELEINNVLCCLAPLPPFYCQMPIFFSHLSNDFILLHICRCRFASNRKPNRPMS
jgi:hypothetical protein